MLLGNCRPKTSSDLSIRAISQEEALRRLEAVTQRSLAQPEEVDSVGGLALSRLDAPIRAGQTFHWDGLEIRVEAMDGDRPSRFLVRDTEPVTAPSQA